jgi:hypothetical protein
LKERSEICDFDKMLWEACEKFGGTKNPSVRFERIDSSLRMNGSPYPPVLSICRSPGKSGQEGRRDPLCAPPWLIISCQRFENAISDSAWLPSTPGGWQPNILSYYQKLAERLRRKPSQVSTSRPYEATHEID